MIRIEPGEEFTYTNDTGDKVTIEAQDIEPKDFNFCKRCCLYGSLQCPNMDCWDHVSSPGVYYKLKIN